MRGRGDDAGAGEHGTKRIAYLMTRFPKITETFILREMDALAGLGWEVEPFALVREREYVAHPGVEAFLARATFSREHTAATIRANLAELARHPMRYLGLLAGTFRWCGRAPGMLARSLLAFPVAVYWARLVRERGIAHLHAHFATHATYMAYAISRLTGVGYSFTAHAHDIYMDQTMLAEKVRRAELVVAISEYNRQLLTGLCPDAAAKIHTVYCGIDTRAFQPRRRDEPDVPDVPDVPANGEQPLRIVTVARMQEYKGLRYLIEACRLLAGRGVAFDCTLIGDGPERGLIERAIARYGLGDSVRLAGWLPSMQVAERLAAADVVALPSVIARNGMMEGLPNVLMEALACGVPVVSTTISGIPELVASGANGLLVPPQDPHALADALATLAADPALRHKMGTAGRERVIAGFDLRTNTERKARLFDDVLRAPHTASPTPSPVPAG